MLVTNLPHQYNYTTWDEVFQSENGQQVGWARETVSLTGTAGVYQIGTLVILSADNKAITVPATQAALAAAASGKLAILAGKEIKGDCSNGFDPNIVELKTGYLTEPKAIVVFDARNGGAIGDAEIKFPSDSNAANKEAIFTRLKVENGFKVLKQAVKG